MTSAVSSARISLGTKVTRLQLNAEEASVVFDLSNELARLFSSPQNPEIFAHVEVVAGRLPQRARMHLAEARINNVDAAVVEGLWVDDDAIGTTPKSWRFADTAESHPYAFTALLLGVVLGDVIGWEAQQAGRLVTDIIPSPGAEESMVSSSSTKELSWHTEDAFSAHRADWVGLFCLRNPGSVATTIGGVSLQEIPPEIRQVLSEPRFILAPDPAHEIAHSDRFEPVAALTKSEEGNVLRADRDFISAVPDDMQAATALAWLVDHIDSNLEDIVLHPGEMGFINNKSVVHGRRSFTPKYVAGNERWLKRTNIIRDIRTSRPGRTSDESRTILAV